MGKNSGRYSDIIDLSHHQSIHRPHMTVYNRAAQFAPFAALTGYDRMVQNTADILLLDTRIILSEDEKSTLDRKLQVLLENIDSQPEFTVSYFDDEAKKFGGGYVTHFGKLKKLEAYPPMIIFTDGKKVAVDSIVMIDGDIFTDL